MRLFKLTDMWLSAILLVIFTVLSIINPGKFLITGYLTVGCWQVISMIIHAINKWFIRRKGNRYYYHRVVAVTLVIALAGFFTPLFFLIFYVLLFATPIMAVFYVTICYKEIQFMTQRPLSMLK